MVRLFGVAGDIHPASQKTYLDDFRQFGFQGSQGEQEHAHEIRRFTSIERIAERVRNIFKLTDEGLLSPGKHPNRVKARNVFDSLGGDRAGPPGGEKSV